MPFDVMIIAYILVEHLIVQMVGKIDRLETLHLCQIPTFAGEDAEAKTYAAHAFVCQSSNNGVAIARDGRFTTTEGVSI